MSVPADTLPSEADGAVRELARSSAEALLELLRAMQSSPLDPDRIRLGAERLEVLVVRWLEAGEPLRVGFERHRLTFNDHLAPLEVVDFTMAARYTDQWKLGGVSGIVFLAPVPPRELTKILLIPFNPKARGDLDWIRVQVARYAPKMAVQLLPLRRSSLPAFFEVDGRQLTADLIWTLRFLSRQAPRSSEHGAAMRRLRRLAEQLTDFSAQAERLLSQVIVPPPMWPSACRTVHSAMLAVLFGQSLGLSRPLLVELGLASLLCDIAGVAAETESDGSLAAADFLAGLGFFARGTRIDPVTLQALIVGCEQHQRPPLEGGSGSPRPHLYSRITLICRTFLEAVHRGSSPRSALQQLALNPRGELDAGLVRSFAHLLGPVPVGSVVRLSAKAEAGVVCGTWRDRAGRRQAWILELGTGRKRFKALLTEPASGDEELPRVLSIELGDVDLVHNPDF
jgi:hypothetical protein